MDLGGVFSVEGGYRVSEFGVLISKARRTPMKGKERARGGDTPSVFDPDRDAEETAACCRRSMRREAPLMTPGSLSLGLLFHRWRWPGE